VKRVLAFLGVVLVIALAPGLIVQLCVAVARALVSALAQVLGVHVA
jgi:hypothetical protein